MAGRLRDICPENNKHAVKVRPCFGLKTTENTGSFLARPAKLIEGKAVESITKD